MNFLDQVKDKRIYIEIPKTLGIYIPPNMKEVNNIFSIREYISEIELSNMNVPGADERFLLLLEEGVYSRYINGEQINVPDIDEISYFYDNVSSMLWYELDPFINLINENHSFERWFNDTGVILKPW